MKNNVFFLESDFNPDRVPPKLLQLAKIVQFLYNTSTPETESQQPPEIEIKTNTPETESQTADRVFWIEVSYTHEAETADGRTIPTSLAELVNARAFADKNNAQLCIIFDGAIKKQFSLLYPNNKLLGYQINSICENTMLDLKKFPFLSEYKKV